MLSTTSGMLCACAILAILSISTTSELGISECFNLNSLSIRLDCRFNSIIIKRIYECSFNSVIWKCMCKKVICSAVDILSLLRCDLLHEQVPGKHKLKSAAPEPTASLCYTTFKSLRFSFRIHLLLD